MPALGKNENEFLFLYVPISRFLIMGILSMGLYGAYWIYKNFQYLKNRDSLSIIPFVRAIFSVFYCHDACKAIRYDKELNLYKPSHFTHYLGDVWALLMIISAIVPILVIRVILVVIGFLCLIPVQKYINQANQMKNPTVNYYPWSTGHIIVIIFVIYLF